MSVFTQEIDFSQGVPDIATNPASKVIGFQASAVYIYNYTAYWIWLKDAESFIPPFWMGACRILYHTTDYAYFEIKSPYGIAQSPADPSFSLRLTWTNDPAVYIPGSDVNSVTNVQSLFNYNVQNNLFANLGVLNLGIQTTAIHVETDPIVLEGAVVLPQRKSLVIQNISDEGYNVIIGENKVDLIDTGTLIIAGGAWRGSIGPDLKVYGVAEYEAYLRVMELA